MKPPVEKEASPLPLSLSFLSPRFYLGPLSPTHHPLGLEPIPLVPEGQFSQGCLAGQRGPVREQRQCMRQRQCHRQRRVLPMSSPCHGPATLPASLGVRGPPSLLWLLVAPGGEGGLRGREQRQKEEDAYRAAPTMGPWTARPWVPGDPC